MVAVSGLDPLLRCLLCRGPRLNTMDDHRRTLFAGASTGCYERCCSSQLECKLFRWHWVPHHANDIGKLHVPPFQRLLGPILGVYISQGARNEEQDI